MKKTYLLQIALFPLLLIIFLLPAGHADADAVSLGTISPGTSVPAGTTITFHTYTDDFIDTKYTMSDSFPGSTLSNSDLNNNGQFVWTTNQSDVGTHTITINATDSFNHQATVTQTFIVGPYTPLSIQSITPSNSVYPYNTVSFAVASPGYVSPTYSLTDSFPGSSISQSNINSSGIFIWTPTPSDMGIHTLSIRVTGQGGRSDVVFETITVKGISIQSPPASGVVGSNYSFTINQYGLNDPSFQVRDNFPGNSINFAGFNMSQFNWEPQPQDVGTHVLTIIMNDTDGGTASASTTVIVTPTAVSTPPVTTTTSSQTSTSSTATSSAPSTTSSGVGDVFTSYLTIGSSGTEVSALQALLAQLHFFSGAATGYYGSVTEKAVEAFQKAHGIAQLGVVGPSTRQALNVAFDQPTSSSVTTSNSSQVVQAYTFEKALSVGSSGIDVTALQKRLISDGYLNASATGYFGAQTESAVISFQKANGLTAIGSVGPATRALLNAGK